jgi:hypothetical protein
LCEVELDCVDERTVAAASENGREQFPMTPGVARIPLETSPPGTTDAATPETRESEPRVTMPSTSSIDLDAADHDAAQEAGWISRSARCRVAFEAAVGRFRESERARADLLAAFLDLDARCEGDIELMAALLRSGDPNWATAQEIWFDIGRAAAFDMRRDITERIGRFLVETSAPTDGRKASAPPPRRARGLHLLALAASRVEAGDYAVLAVKSYGAAGCAVPTEIAALLPWSMRRRRRTLNRPLAGLPPRLSWREIEVRIGDPDEHSAIVTVRRERRLVSFEDLGMRDWRGMRPSKRWELLKCFAFGEGRLPRLFDPDAVSIEGLVHDLRLDLSAAFDIVSDPIPLRLEGKKRVWECEFLIEDGRELRYPIRL